MALVNGKIMTLPVLALRGAAVYPSTVLHFDVERPMSIAALNAAISGDRMIFLVSQKDLSCSVPGEEDIFSVGTVCRVTQILRTPSGGTIKCIVDGIYRGKLLRITSEAPCLWGNVKILTNKPCETDSIEVQALLRSCSELFAEYAGSSGSVAPEILLRVAGIKDPSFLSDFISQNVFLQPALKQQLLEELDPEKRLRLLVDTLKHEIEIMGIQEKLQITAASRMEKNQKDYYLREQLKIIREELGESDDENEIDSYRKRIEELALSEEVTKKLLKEVSHLAKQPFGSAEGAVIRTYLDVCLELPWKSRTDEITDIIQAQKILDDDHYGLYKVKERIIEYLAVRQRTPNVKGGVLCLIGPPGVGKTSIAMSIARAVNRKLARVSLGGVHDEAEIRGHRKTYVGAMPGRIITGIQQAGSRNPVIVLDEIDKLGSDHRGDPSAALLEALDPEQNSLFRDHFLEIPFDLSEVLFITTANSADTIPPALLDRMEVIHVGSYTDEEKLQIAKRYLIPKQRTKHGLNGNQLRLSDDAIRFLIAHYTRESGVRHLEQQIASLCRKAAKKIESGDTVSLRIRPGMLPVLLGPIRYKESADILAPSVGLVHGLAWTSVGGEMLDVECAVIPGSGKIELTGNLGSVMKESCQTALTYIRSKADSLCIAPDFYKTRDIHLHFPEGAVPKDGPSAGITITLAMISALTGSPVRGDIAMTGEITLRGRVLLIGGIQEKAMGALRAGIHTILLPKSNVPDLDEIDKDVRSQIQFIPVEHMDEVLSFSIGSLFGKDKDNSFISSASCVMPQGECHQNGAAIQ